MYVCDNSSLKRFFQLILSNVSYSGYRNHIQKYTLQERVKFGPCDWQDNMLIYGLGGETEQHPKLR